MSTPLDSVNCNNCGAPLEVAPTTQFVTCARCGTHLAIRRTGTSAYTEPQGQAATVEELGRHLDDQLAGIRLQNEVARLDREWGLERERYMISGRYGARYIPTPGMSILGGIVIVAFGGLWTAMATTIAGGAGVPFACFPLFGILFMLFGAGVSIYSFTKAKQYQQAYEAYRHRRARLLSGAVPTSGDRRDTG